MKYYVYKHLRLDDNKVFYIGKGSQKARAFVRHNRNIHWNSVVKKHGYRVEIARYFECEENALKYERYLQVKYTDKGFRLANLAVCGGMGARGVRHSKERKEKISQASKRLWAKESHVKFMKERAGGLNNPFSDKTPYTLYHKDHGLITLTQYEFRQKYKISSSHLGGVIKGKRNHSDGWCLPSNKDFIIGDGRIFTWTHPFHETHTGRKAELLKLFPHLDQTCLCRLISGEYKQSRGWSIAMT
jgi:hypothetical protein